jgi:UDP:flavonoid glycosyltransferase YjiC (YdhE family)
MHITMIALGSTGDILPYIALGKGLKDAGHQIRFITFQGFESRIRKLELDFFPIPGDPQALVAQGGTNIFSMARSFGSLANEYIQALSDPLLLDTDLFINQLPGGLFGIDLAEKAGVPMITAAVIPLAPTREFQMMGFPLLPFPGYNIASYTLAEMVAWMLFRKVIREWRTRTLGLPLTTRKEYFRTGGSRHKLNLYGFSPQVVKRPGDWSEDIHITGYWFPDDPNWMASPELDRFIEDGSPPVFIGFGSMPIKDPSRITRLILSALEETGQRSVLHAGWGKIGAHDLPDSVYLIDYAPYGWLFPRMGMVIHHGGSGTTGFGLRSGVPSCAIPLGFDQIYWGKRIAALGAGPESIRVQGLTSSRLAALIRSGINDDRMRRRAADVSRRILSEDGIGIAVQLIDKVIRPGQ